MPNTTALSPSLSPLLLTVRETAQVLHLHEMTIRKLVWAGSLPCIRIGKAIRFHRTAVEAFASTGTTLTGHHLGHKVVALV